MSRETIATHTARRQHEYLRDLVEYAREAGVKIPEEAERALTRPECEWSCDSYRCDLLAAINTLEQEL